jgi:hypothetical protein
VRAPPSSIPISPKTAFFVRTFSVTSAPAAETAQIRMRPFEHDVEGVGVVADVEQHLAFAQRVRLSPVPDELGGRGVDVLEDLEFLEGGSRHFRDSRNHHGRPSPAAEDRDLIVSARARGAQNGSGLRAAGRPGTSGVVGLGGAGVHGIGSSDHFSRNATEVASRTGCSR